MRNLSNDVEVLKKSSGSQEGDDREPINVCISQNGDSIDGHATVQAGRTNQVGELGSVRNDTELEKLKITVDKLESLLTEQQKELEDLKWKHELAVSDLLKELSPESRTKVFYLCSEKIPDYRMHCGTNFYGGHSTWSGPLMPSSQVSRLVVDNSLGNTSGEESAAQSSGSINIGSRFFHVRGKIGSSGAMNDKFAVRIV